MHEFARHDLHAVIDGKEPPRETLPAAYAALSGLLALLRLKMAAPMAQPAPAPAKEPTELLTAAEAAERLGVDRKWMYRNADTLPFTRRLSARVLRFDAAGLERWAARQRP